MRFNFNYIDKCKKAVPVSFEIGIDVIQKEIFTHKNFYEASLLKFIEVRLGKGLVYVDIGANIGNHSIFFVKICQAKKVYAFEPHKPNIALFKKNLVYNKIINIELHEIGLADREYKALAIARKGNLGNTNLIEDNGGDIRVTTLDSILKDGNCKKIDVIKIDVQGMELDVLKGAKNVIKRHLPCVFAEVRHKKHLYCDPEVFEFLEQFGYREIVAFGSPPAVVMLYACRKKGGVF